MKLYELYILLKPTLSEGEVNEFSAKTSETLVRANFNVDSSIIKINEYIPYIIQHFRQAHVVDLEISAGGETVFSKELDQDLSRNENVLKHLVFGRSEKMVLKRAKQAPIIEQLLRERKYAQVSSPNEPSVNLPTPDITKPDMEEIDKKLEEILK